MSALAVTLEAEPVETLAVVFDFPARRRPRVRRVVAEYACERCGTTFGAKQRRASFCSSACRQAAYRERRSNGEPPAPTGLTLEELLARNEHVRRADDLEAILRCSERMGVVEQVDGRWRLTEPARRRYGAALASLENA